MDVIEYFDAVKERLTTSPAVASFAITREHITLIDGHLRARVSVSNGSLLEFSEYVQRSPDGQIDVVTYSYHWAGAAGRLIRRWDNAPHFPDLPGFPHHVHNGLDNSVATGKPASIFAVLDEIAGGLE